MTRIRAFILLLLVLAVAAWPVWHFWHPTGNRAVAEGTGAPEPPETVSDMTVLEQPWQSRIKAFGQTRAVQGAELSSQVPGIVDEIDFQSGQDVKAGTVLLRLRLYDDPAKLQPLQAEVS